MGAVRSIEVAITAAPARERLDRSFLRVRLVVRSSKSSSGAVREGCDRGAMGPQISPEMPGRERYLRPHHDAACVPWEGKLEDQLAGELRDPGIVGSRAVLRRGSGDLAERSGERRAWV